MSRSDIHDIGILKSLYQALPQYCGRSFEITQSFASILLKKLNELKDLEPHFIRRIEIARANLNSCVNNPHRSSCASERADLNQAKADYKQYQAEINRLENTFATYKNAESKYANSLDIVKTKTATELNRIIQHLSEYASKVNETTAAASFSLNPINLGGNTSISNVGEKTAKVTSSSANQETTGNNSTTANVNATVNSEVANSSSNTIEGDGISTTTVVASGIGSGIVATIATAMIASYLQRRETINKGASLEESLIDKAFREKYSIGKTEILLMQSSEKDGYIKKYNALCAEIEIEAKQQYNEKIDEIKKHQIEKQEYDYAVLAGHVYNPEIANEINWNVVSLDSLKRDDSMYYLVEKINEFNHDGSGFYAQLYKNDFTGEYTLAFRGSDFPEANWRDLNPISRRIFGVKGKYHLDDWIWTNAAQGLGFPSKQYDNAKSLGEIIRNTNLKNTNLKIIGHSLGGGLATVAGLKSEYQTYTYNQAELTHATIKRLNLETNNHESIIKAYHDPKEFLIRGQNSANNAIEYISSEKLARAINKSEVNFAQDMFEANKKDASKKIEIDSPNNYFSRLGTVEYIDSKGEHGMNYVINYFKKKHAKTLSTNQFNNLNFITHDKFEENFKINGISEALPESENIKIFKGELKKLGIVGIVSKNKR